MDSDLDSDSDRGSDYGSGQDLGSNSGLDSGSVSDSGSRPKSIILTIRVNKLVQIRFGLYMCIGFWLRLSFGSMLFFCLISSCR